MKKSKQQLPPGWTEKRVRQVIDHYENQTEEEAIAEDEAAYSDPDSTMMSVPNELVPALTQFILQYEKATARNGRKLRIKKVKARKA